MHFVLPSLKNDPGVSWSKINDYAFNQFIRCAPPQDSTHKKQQCFKCSQEGHYANNCPNETFRPPRSQQQSNFLANQVFQNPIHNFSKAFALPCRHYNNNNFCKNPQCPWPHSCNRCGGDHLGTACRASRGKFQPASKYKPNTN